MLLHKALAADSILLTVLAHECFAICNYVISYLIKALNELVFVDPVKVVCTVCRSAYVADIANIQPSAQSIGNFNYLTFSHAVNEKIRVGIDKN